MKGAFQSIPSHCWLTTVRPFTLTLKPKQNYFPHKGENNIINTIMMCHSWILFHQAIASCICIYIYILHTVWQFYLGYVLQDLQFRLNKCWWCWWRSVWWVNDFEVWSVSGIFEERISALEKNGVLQSVLCFEKWTINYNSIGQKVSGMGIL